AALLHCSDEYIAHEYLEDTNEPCSFRDFVDAAGRRGLVYLAEAELPTMILSNFPAAMAEMVQKFGGNSLLAAEQYIDMASGRTFRHTLVVAAERAAQIDRNLSDDRLDGLHFIGHV